MKKINSALLLFSAGLIMNACNGDATKGNMADADSTASESSVTTDTATTAGRMDMDTSTAKMNAQPLAKNDSDFLMKAASGGMMEVELGKVAQEKAKSQRVKDFGGMMVTDHSAANDELKSLASSKNLTLPADVMPDAKKHMDMMSSKSGADFDKAYTSMMVDDHKKDIADFKKAAENSTDADIKSFASKTLPVLQKHLDSIQAIHKMKM